MGDFFNDYSGSHSSGYSGDHHGSFSSHGDCCPLVVDPLTYSALLAFLAAAVYFFQVLIEMSMLAMRRKRRRKRELNFGTLLAVDILDVMMEGKLSPNRSVILLFFPLAGEDRH